MTKTEEFTQHLGAEFARRAMEAERNIVKERVNDLTAEQIEAFRFVISVTEDDDRIRAAIIEAALEGTVFAGDEEGEVTEDEQLDH